MLANRRAEILIKANPKQIWDFFRVPRSSILKLEPHEEGVLMSHEVFIHVLDTWLGKLVASYLTMSRDVAKRLYEHGQNELVYFKTEIERLCRAAPAISAAILGRLVWVRSRKERGAATPMADGVQEATILVRNGYHPDTIRVHAGRPVRLVFQRAEDNPCSARVYLAEPPLNRYLLPFATTAIVFTPDRIGTHLFTCEEGRFRGRLIVEPPRPAPRLSRDSPISLMRSSASASMLGAERTEDRHSVTLGVV